MTGLAGLRLRALVALGVLAAVVCGIAAYLVYPVLDSRGAFALLVVALVLLASGLVVGLLALRRGALRPRTGGSGPRPPSRADLTSSVQALGREIDASEQRLKLAMQQYAEQSLLGLQGNYARLEAVLKANVADGAAQAAPSPAALPDAVEKIVEAQDRIYGQVEGLVRVLALMRGETPLPATYGNWAARPDCLAVLLSLVEERQPRLVVECGSGVSTLVLAKAVQRNGSGRVLSLEHDEGYAAATAALLERHGISEAVTLHVRELVEHELSGDEYPWYDLDGLATPEGIDLLFVDGPPGRTREQARYPALPLLCDRLARDAVVVLDDTRRPDEAHVAERWRQEFEWLNLHSIPTAKGTVVLTAHR